MEQRTEEWHQARLGKVTASRIADVTARTKSGWGAARANYMAELICERLTGARQGGFESAAMQWGTETEDQARAAYEFHHDVDVTQVGFIDHPEVPSSGASPDGLVGGDGLVEIKCPNTATHIQTLISGKVPEKYIKQMQWQMACTSRQWCDFVSYDPRLPSEMQLFVRRMDRNDEKIRSIEKDVTEFIGEMKMMVSKLVGGVAPAPRDREPGADDEPGDAYDWGDENDAAGVFGGKGGAA